MKVQGIVSTAFFNLNENSFIQRKSHTAKKYKYPFNSILYLIQSYLACPML
jgi:hypothetical protein